MDTDTKAALRRQAQDRLNFIRWIAQRLEEPEDSPEIRRQAAQILRQLLEDAQADATLPAQRPRLIRHRPSL
jgi:hypothetical protein